MKNNETGEFELVLGNRQLLSGFFIVVLLFGVAFAMGYIVGRNSTPSAKLQAEAASTATAAGKDARPQPVTPAQPDQTAPPSDSSQPAAADQSPAQPPAETPAPPVPQPTTQAAAPPPAQAAPPTPRQAPPAPAGETPSAVAEAPPGSYWQVIATSNRTSAEALSQSLKDKGFPVTLSPGPNNLVRVLVGPYSDTQAMGRAKTRLEDAGFHPVRK
ncbi:MAG: SPOR domain-containing protein [Acidobacteriia bacterium]|nr:SPOR domain-containing protein [Terriglobia bacterium]